MRHPEEGHPRDVSPSAAAAHRQRARRSPADYAGLLGISIIPLPPSIALRREVFRCDACGPLRLGFERPAPGLPFFKFPPLIGAQGPAPLLFVGLNPRRSDTNLALHDQLMADPAAFDALAENRVDGRPYVAIDGKERHYRLHAGIAAALFPDQPFEAVAAVTELFLCATVDAGEVRKAERRCADRYLQRVVQLVRPRVIFAFGRDAEKHFRPNFGSREGPFRAAPGGVRALVVPVRHPSAWGDRGTSDEDAVTAAAAELGLELGRVAPTETVAPGAPPDAHRPADRTPRVWPWALLTGASLASLATIACCCGGGS